MHPRYTYLLQHEMLDNKHPTESRCAFSTRIFSIPRCMYFINIRYIHHTPTTRCTSATTGVTNLTSPVNNVYKLCLSYQPRTPVTCVSHPSIHPSPARHTTTAAVSLLFLLTIFLTLVPKSEENEKCSFQTLSFYGSVSSMAYYN